MAFVPDEQPSGSRFVPDQPSTPAPTEYGIGDWLKALTGYTPPVLGYKLNKTLDELTKRLAYKAGGAVTDLAATHMSPEAAAGLGTAANFGVNAIPVIAGALAGRAAAPLMESGAKGVMQIAVNPSPQDLVSGKAARAVDTLLKHDISPTASGMHALRTQIGELDNQVANIIKNSPETIQTGGVFESLKPAMDRFIRAGNPEDIAAMRKAWFNFVNHPMIQGNAEIPIQTAQAIKTAKNSLLDTRVFGELGSAQTAAEKGLTHGLKTGIELKAPEVVPINKLSSELRNVIDVSERKALMKLAHNPVDMAFVFSTPEHYAAYTFGRSKAFLGALARIMYHNKESIPAGVGAAAGAVYSDLKNRQEPKQE